MNLLQGVIAKAVQGFYSIVKKFCHGNTEYTEKWIIADYSTNLRTLNPIAAQILFYAHLRQT